MLDNKKELDEWFKSLIAQGGNVYSVNFRDYYQQHYCDKVSKIPEILLANTNVLKNSTIKELSAFSTLSDSNFEKLYSMQRLMDLDFAAHTFSILDEPFIKFLPTIVWSQKHKKFSVENGQSRVFNKYINSQELTCIHIRYPGHPELDAERKIILNIDELYHRIVYPTFENSNRRLTIVKPYSDIYDNSVSRHGILVYGDTTFHLEYRSNWKSNILRYHSYALKIDLLNFNLDDLKYENWKTRSPKYKVDYSKENGGILKLRK